MAIPAKIFISSAYDENLKPLRRKIRDHLNGRGHEGIIFEKDGHPWSADTMERCLKLVNHSDIFVLLINDNIGTYWPDTKDTPTYQEFYNAVESKKYVMAFVDENVLRTYEEYFDKSLNDRLKAYVKQNHREPVYMVDLVDEIYDQELGPMLSKKLDEKYKRFLWAFIFEVRRSKVWTEKLVNWETSDLLEKIDEYFSEHLRTAVKLIPEQAQTEENKMAFEDLKRLKTCASEMLSLIDNGTVTNWNSFLNSAADQLVESEICVRRGTRTAGVVNTLGKCDAVTVYKQENRSMNLCGSYGNTNPTAQYLLSNHSSYVANCYQNNVTLIGFAENKQLLYYATRTNEFVVCFHFPLTGDSWSAKQVSSYNTEIECAIIETNNLIIEFVADLIGGVQK